MNNPAEDTNGAKEVTLKTAGASPAIPRDPRLLEAERAAFEAKAAQREAEELRKAAEEAAAKAAAAKAAAEKTNQELEAAREEAIAKAKAAALQVRLEKDEEERALQAARAQAKADRDEKLGTVHTVEQPEPEIITVTKRTTDGFIGSFGLFILRIIAAGFTGIIGWQAMVNRIAVIEALTYTGISDSVAYTMAFFLGAALIAVAVALLLGLATRIISAVLLGGTAAFLAFFRFGPFSPFIEGKFGFYGDREVLLAAIFWILLMIGAGGWSIDARIRNRRNRVREDD